MEDSSYEIMSLSPEAEVEYQESAANNFTYTANDCYQLQTCQQKNTTTGADDGGSRSVGSGTGAEVEHSNMKGDSQKGMKICLIALVFAVVLMAVVTIAALALAVINYSHLSGELTNEVSFYGQIKPHCGAGLWYRVAFLNMSDPSQQCPSAWRLVTTNGVRACGRPVSSGSSCQGMFYSAINEYQQVCGRVIGYQDSSLDGFNGNVERRSSSVDDVYLDGVSVTYGQPRNHVWSYVGGATEGSTRTARSNCPCSTVSAGTGPQSFVGDNYYCESGNPTDANFTFYSADKLWDGKQCEGTCCTDSKSPPWFSVHLPNTTTDRIEVRICGDEGTNNEDTPIELLEILVQ